MKKTLKILNGTIPALVARKHRGRKSFRWGALKRLRGETFEIRLASELAAGGDYGSP